MKLQINQLRAFRTAAQGIKQNGILPILSYLKFDNGIITKNNLESFVQMKAEFIGSVLIDERVLYTFLDFTIADDIEVTVKGTSCTITDGKTKKISPTDDVKLFPATAECEGATIELDSVVLSGIKTAMGFTDEASVNEYCKYVFIGDKLLAASNNFMAYTQPCNIENKIIIGHDAALVIIKQQSINFSENATYQFYQIGDLQYGFCKTEVPFINFTPHSKLPAESPVVANKQCIIKFCDMCVSDTPSRVVVAEFFGGAMQMTDAAYGITNTSPMDIVLEDFTFNPWLMSRMLKSLPGDELQFIRSGAKYYVTDGNFVALIMEMKP
jgi:hypothetical protein